MTIPNLITIGRLIIVPLVIVMIMQGRWATAFMLFVVAGVSDAIDGFIARRFDMRSEFGAYIDPARRQGAARLDLCHASRSSASCRAGSPSSSSRGT